MLCTFYHHFSHKKLAQIKVRDCLHRLYRMGEYPLIEKQLAAGMAGMHKTFLQFFLQIIHFRNKFELIFSLVQSKNTVEAL